MAELTVATLNLHLNHHRWLGRRHLIVEAILDAQPDLVGFQEVYRPGEYGRWLRQQINSRLSGESGEPYRLFQKRKHHLIQGYFEGLAVLTRLPVLAHDYLPLGYGGRIALRLNVEVSARETLDFVNVHLHHVAADREAREEQVMAIMGWLSESNPVPLQIIAGDFNELPSGPAIRRMKQRYRSALVEARGYEPVATFPTALVPHDDDWAGCLDYIFVSKALGPVLEAGLFCNRAPAEDPTLYPSDHIGLIAKVETRGKPLPFRPR
ncbi:MAG: endonuclease/exonuclease/phosphatase family protein [Candidatus Promineifilaceae bacterium]|nr:endonuclease/exonuclease/phosphatase family protein [Candidatus Promineifilaceae bacterium]